MLQSPWINRLIWNARFAHPQTLSKSNDLLKGGARTPSALSDTANKYT